MEILKFKLSGKSAFFKKPEVNTYCYFTYGNIHRVALLGILGAILGYKGYSQMQDILSNKKKKGKLESSYPEFYEKLKDLKIAILPLNNKGIISKKIQIFNNSVGYASKEQGGNLIVKEQWLENPKWEICILLDCEEAKKIKEAIQNHKCKFYPYLGTNDHFADIEYLGVEEAQLVIQDDYRIDSFMEKDNIEFIEKNSRQLRKILSEDEIELYSRFKYEEALPKNIDAEVNNYKLERFVYTNGFVKFLDGKQVYSILNQDNKETIEAKKRKNIVFY